MEKPSSTWWDRVTQDGFTELCKRKFGEFITADTTDGIRILQQRAAMLATLEALRQSKARKMIRHANVVSRN